MAIPGRQKFEVAGAIAAFCLFVLALHIILSLIFRLIF